jgi:hypothetical protein
VGCQVAVTLFPFDGRLGASAAVPTGAKLGRTIAALARFDDLMAESTVVAASLSGHKCTLGTFANGITNHNNHLIYTNFDTKKPDTRSSGSFSRITSACPIDKRNGIVKRYCNCGNGFWPKEDTGLHPTAGDANLPCYRHRGYNH